MTTMKDIAQMSDKDLVSFITEKRESVRTARFGAAARNVRAIRTTKREIARALTEITRRGTTAQ